MKKKELSRDKWLTLFVLITGLLFFSVIGLILVYLFDAQKPEEYKAYSYQHNTNLDYCIHLLPNSILPETFQQSGRAYLKSLTDYISTDFKYNFKGDKDAVISGTYSVTANLVASTNGDKEYIVWNREYNIIPIKEFNTSGNEVSIQKSVNIPIAKYIEYAEWVITETKYTPQNLNLIVKYDVQLNAQTDSGVLDDEIIPTIVIPLDRDEFTVGGDLQKEDSGDITSIQIVSIKWVYTARMFFMISTGLLAVILIIFLILTIPKKERKTTPEEKMLFNILKKYSARIALFNIEKFNTPDNILKIDSFKDLLKVADELGMPILYHRNEEDASQEHTFNVMTPNYTYQYIIKIEFNNDLKEVNV